MLSVANEFKLKSTYVFIVLIVVAVVLSLTSIEPIDLLSFASPLELAVTYILFSVNPIESTDPVAADYNLETEVEMAIFYKSAW